MNYIKEIRAMHDAQATRPLSTGQKLLWYELMYICNTAGWPEWFDVWSSDIESRTGLSRSGVLKARKALQKLGYLEAVPRGTKATRYRMISQAVKHCFDENDTAETSDTVHEEGIEESTQDGAQVGTQESTQESTQVGAQVGTHIPKLNETKLNETKGNNPPISPQKEPPEPPPKKRTAKKAAGRDVFAEFAGEDTELLQTLRDFEAMRKEIKRPLTDRAKKLTCDRLRKLSPVPATQVRILEQSIMHCWQGVFELDKPKRAKDEGNIFLEMLKEREAAREEADLIEL